MVDVSLAPQVLGPLLRTRWAGRSLTWIERCGSTNDEASALGRDGASHGTCVLANLQEAGRGRMGRTWFAHPRASLCLSLLLRPTLSVGALPPLALVVGVAIHELLASAGARASLKWPNDVLIEGRKVGGILVETSIMGDEAGFVIVGIGLNVNQDLQDFPASLQASATSLAIATGKKWNRAELAAQLLEGMERHYDRFIEQGPGPALHEFRKAAAPMMGRPVRVTWGAEEPLEGIAERILDDGTLLVRDAENTLHEIAAGDVELVGKTS